MSANHERFADFHAGPVSDRFQLRAFRDVQRIGFSQSTCLPASAALIDPGHMQMIRQRVVDGFDFRIVNRSSYDPYALAIPKGPAASRARSRIAGGDGNNLGPLAVCIAGITFFTAIPATPKTPQRTLVCMNPEFRTTQ